MWFYNTENPVKNTRKKLLLREHRSKPACKRCSLKTRIIWFVNIPKILTSRRWRCNRWLWWKATCVSEISIPFLLFLLLFVLLPHPPNRSHTLVVSLSLSVTSPCWCFFFKFILVIYQMQPAKSLFILFLFVCFFICFTFGRRRLRFTIFIVSTLFTFIKQGRIILLLLLLFFKGFCSFFTDY